MSRKERRKETKRKQGRNQANRKEREVERQKESRQQNDRHRPKEIERERERHITLNSLVLCSVVVEAGGLLFGRKKTFASAANRSHGRHAEGRFH